MTRKPLNVGLMMLLLPVALAGAWFTVQGKHAEMVHKANERLAKAEAARAKAAKPGLGPGERDEALLKAAWRETSGQAKLIEAAQFQKKAVPWSVVALVPLWLGVLMLFHPGTIAALRTWRPGKVAWLGAGLAVWSVGFSAHGFWTETGFNPYALAIVGMGAAAAILATRRGLTDGRICGVGLAVWLLLWIPFDLRWFKGVWLGGSELAYELFALLIVIIAALAYAVVGRLDSVGLSRPRSADVGKALIYLLAIGVVLIPIGLATGFLQAKLAGFSASQVVFLFLGLVFTVALPEELFFRGILDAGLQKHISRPWVSLLISSFAFGLMHWNNRGNVEERLLYLFLATIAGVFYGLTFRKSKGLVAPVLVHATVDLAWQAFLGG